MTGEDNAPPPDEFTAHIAGIAGEAGAKITTAIVDMVAEEMARLKVAGLQPEIVEPFLRGIAAAYVTLAIATGSTDEAQAMLLDLADALDDAEGINWIVSRADA